MTRSNRSTSFLVESIVDRALCFASRKDEAIVKESRIQAIEQWRENPSIVEQWEVEILQEDRYLPRLQLASKIEEIWHVTANIAGRGLNWRYRQFYAWEYRIYVLAEMEEYYWFLYVRKLKTDKDRPFTKGRTLFPKPPFDFKKIFSQGGVR